MCTVGQIRLSSIAVIYVEKSCANHIIHISVDRIIDVFGKTKNHKSFMWSVYVLIILLYI